MARAFLSPSLSCKHAEPPAPSSGLITALPADLGDERRGCCSRSAVTSVRGVHSGKLQRVELLVGVAQPARIVDEQRLAARALEQQRRVEVGLIERRILADEDRAHLTYGQVLNLVFQGEERRGIGHENAPRPSADFAPRHIAI